MSRIDWTAYPDGSHRAVMGNVTLVVTPDRYRKGKAAHRTRWHAQCSLWTESTRTVSRFGRDVYMDLQPTAQAARRLAEQIHREAT